ncbi:MAG: DUF1080 domain-containing protein [Armatimonas sp.]
MLRILGVLATLLALIGSANATGFEKLFDGKSLSGWQLVGGHGPGYVVESGNTLTCPADGGGNLFSEKEYSDFHLKFEFLLSPGGNNGIGIRAPLEGDAAYVGMEIQVLDDDAPMYSKLEPGQYHGSIYKVCAAKRGALKPTGQWNREEIIATGRRIQVIVNGKKTVDCDLNTVMDPETLANHPGILRDRGHVGFLGHGSLVKFRNIQLKNLEKPTKDNTAPKGFTSLFDGKSLKNWKGLVENPVKRAQMSAAELANKQRAADEKTFQHWSAKNGEIAYDGKADSLCTLKDYANFELHVDWKIGPGGDSGIYLRGSPQVQIWDTALTNVGAQVGSGGLYNNQKNPSKPTAVADKPVGQWNHFVILMVGDKVTVYLNGQLVVHNVVMENYWDRSQPIFPTGQIELQHHGNPIFFKNVYIRELK